MLLACTPTRGVTDFPSRDVPYIRASYSSRPLLLKLNTINQNSYQNLLDYKFLTSRRCLTSKCLHLFLDLGNRICSVLFGVLQCLKNKTQKNNLIKNAEEGTKNPCSSREWRDPEMGSSHSQKPPSCKFLLQPDGFQQSFVTQQVQNVPGLLPWMLFGQPPLLAKCVDLGLQLYYAAVQNLVYGCENVPQTIAESSDTPPIHCAQHVQQSVDMSTQLPTGVQCDQDQMAEVVQQEHVLIGGAWLYPRVNVANTVHLSKHHSYCLQIQNRGRKNRPSERHLIADDHGI